MGTHIRVHTNPVTVNYARDTLHTFLFVYVVCDLTGILENILEDWLVKFPSAILLLGGDFNNILDCNMDKWPPGKPI